jgi:CubicO group peptidase (beta-lactamase class C family)
MSTQRLSRIHAAMEGFIERHEVAGVVTLIARHGHIVWLDSAGWQDVSGKAPMRSTTIFRMASMTKPLTSVAALMLLEEGRFLLSDPISKYLPEFADQEVFVLRRPDGTDSVVPTNRDITIADLLAHRSGLTYGFRDTGAVENAYRSAGVTDGLLGPVDFDLAENVRRIATAPLRFDPGTQWHYSLSADVLARLIEVASGRPFAAFCRDRIFTPLGMQDSYFYVPDGKVGRIANPYTTDSAGALRPIRAVERFGPRGILILGGAGSRGSQRYASGGAGLLSTAADYARFLQMLLNGGALGDVRLLSPKTIELMTASQTPDNVPPTTALDSLLLPRPGSAFGLGVATITDVGATESLGSVGTYYWDGIYGTTFWVDPKEDMIGVQLEQLYPNSLRVPDMFRVLAYQAVVRSSVATH